MIDTNELIPTHSYSTCHRAINSFNTVSYIKTDCQRSFIVNATQFWNKLLPIIKLISDYYKFKTAVKKYLLRL